MDKNNGIYNEAGKGIAASFQGVITSNFREYLLRRCSFLGDTATGFHELSELGIRNRCGFSKMAILMLSVVQGTCFIKCLEVSQQVSRGTTCIGSPGALGRCFRESSKRRGNQWLIQTSLTLFRTGVV